MGKKERTSGQLPPLNDLDQVAAARLMELLPLTGRTIGPEMARLLVGAEGQGVSGTDYDRKRGRVWIKYEISLPG